MKTIHLHALDDCPKCGGMGRVGDDVKLPCDCILSQIPFPAPAETDYKIHPAQSITQKETHANDQ